MSRRSVAARRDTITLPTYCVGPADPNPSLRRQWGYWRTYPYPMLDDLTDRREDRTYTALVLENEYLRITVLPEVGGHLYAYDKRAGREIFYRPSSIKPALVALRGAWIAGGIEFNFPCSHNYLTMSPVDHLIREHRDGSATIYIGAIEQVSRMRWTVGITLCPGAARIETWIRLENRTCLPHRYYFWSNSAERVTPGTRFITPVTSGYGWKGIMRYPVHEGEYLPAYRGHHGACDLFSRHLQGDFFGCYDDDAEEGVINVADRHRVTGRKYFTWGNSDDGLMWQHILSDSEGPYIEIQSGPFETQSIFKLMEPHQVMSWEECWFPVRGCGGFEHATRDVALNLIRDESGARLLVRPARQIVDATITADVGGRSVGSWDVDLRPEKGVDLALEPIGDDERVHVVITSQADGKIADALVPWRGEEDDLADPVPIGPEERHTVHGLLAQGIAAEQDFNWPLARECYERALALDALAVPPLIRLGVLELKANRADEAVELLRRATRLVPDSGEANYYFGYALRRQGRREEARDALWRARLSPQFGALGRYVLGEMAAEDEEFVAALAHFREAATYEATGTKAWWGQVVMLRNLERFGEASAILAKMAADDPLNPLTACELALVAEAQELPGNDAWTELRRLARNEPQTWLELATDYASLGRFRVACRLIEVAKELAGHALFHYHRAHCLARLGAEDEARREYRRAAEAPGDYVFPHRVEEEAILREAIAMNPTDANAPYYLGTFLYMLGRTDEGRQLWAQAAAKGCANASLYSCQAWAARHIDGDREGAYALYERAVALRPDDHRLHVELDVLREEMARPPEERLRALLDLPEAVRTRGRIPIRLIHLHSLLGQYDEAAALLAARRYHPWEGERAMRPLYVETYLGMGEALLDAGDHGGARRAFEKALEYPINVGVGKPQHPSDAPIYYRAGVACEALGDRAAAREHWTCGAAEEHHSAPSMERFYVECCRMKLGEAAAAAAGFGAIRQALATQAKDRAAGADELALRGLVEGALGDATAARRAFADALALTPGHPLARRELARLGGSPAA